MEILTPSGAVRPLYKNRAFAPVALIILTLACACYTYGVRLGDRLRLKSAGSEEDLNAGPQEAEGLSPGSLARESIISDIQGEADAPAVAQQDETYREKGPDEDVQIHFEIKTLGHITAVSATMKGRRPTDEDAVRTLEQLNSNTYFLGLFDGHGGSETSKYLAEHAYKHIAKAIEAPLDTPREVDKEKIAEACIDLDKKIVMEGICKGSGSTAAMVVVEHDCLTEDLFKVHAINVGDSRVMVLNFDSAPITLTKDHKPNLPEETARIQAAGGEVYDVHGISRVGGCLAVSRAFGDPMFKDYASRPPREQQVVAMPDQQTKNISANSLLLLACDGLFETVDADLEQVFKAALEESDGGLVSAVRKLLLIAYDRGSGDNISVIAAMMHPPAPPYLRTVGELHSTQNLERQSQMAPNVKAHGANVVFVETAPSVLEELAWENPGHYRFIPEHLI